ncbi:MAG: putative DNA binding domain-containing protein [Candidatus Marinimicrobia bacterium]|nr:putative DNA binding domain-containing protein [Candidatus Neomarinimicrobiota bacterium]
MKSDDIMQFESILKKEESETLEFKSSYDKEQVGQIICSFLNKKGGQIVIGCGDKNQVIGVTKAKYKADEIAKYLTKEIVPEPVISVDIQNYKNKNVIMINVWQGNNPPYIYKGSIYYRKNISTVKASSAQLAKLIHSSQEINQRWETKPAIEIELDEIDLNEVNGCIKDVTMANRDINIPSDPIQFLSKYGLYKNGDFTNAAVLMFGKEPVQFFPQVRIRLSVYKTDKTGGNILYDKIFDKNLFQSTTQITDFFDLAYGVSSSFKSTDWKRNDKLGFPRLAVREAILNAIIHRDYSSYSGSVAINIYPDKLKISSYGKFPKGITVKSLAEDHLSIPVNPDIAHIFFLRNWIEKIGRGTVKMISQCRDQGFKIPFWRVHGNSVTVTFPGISVPFNYNEGISEGISEGLNKLLIDYYNEGINEGTSKGITDALKASMQEIIELLIKDKSLRASEITGKLNKPYKTIERHIKTLRDIKAIVYMGSKRAGGYQLTEVWQKLLKPQNHIN